MALAHPVGFVSVLDPVIDDGTTPTATLIPSGTTSSTGWIPINYGASGYTFYAKISDVAKISVTIDYHIAGLVTGSPVYARETLFGTSSGDFVNATWGAKDFTPHCTKYIRFNITASGGGSASCQSYLAYGGD